MGNVDLPSHVMYLKIVDHMSYKDLQLNCG